MEETVVAATPRRSSRIPKSATLFSDDFYGHSLKRKRSSGAASTRSTRDVWSTPKRAAQASNARTPRTTQSPAEKALQATSVKSCRARNMTPKSVRATSARAPRATQRTAKKIIRATSTNAAVRDLQSPLSPTVNAKVKEEEIDDAPQTEGQHTDRRRSLRLSAAAAAARLKKENVTQIRTPVRRKRQCKGTPKKKFVNPYLAEIAALGLECTSSSESSGSDSDISTAPSSANKKKYGVRRQKKTKKIPRSPRKTFGPRCPQGLGKLPIDENMADILYDNDIISHPPTVFIWDLNETKIFMDEWLLLEKMKHLRHTSPVYRVVNIHGIYGDLRCFTQKEISSMYQEVLCLDKMEKFGKSYMFRKVCEMNAVKTEGQGYMSYLITYHRPSVSLKDIIKTENGLDSRSATRIGIEMFEIIENLLKAKMLMAEISTDFFAIDTISQKLFLSDSSKVIGNFERSALPNRFPAPKWQGKLIYAPYNYHLNKDVTLCEGDLIESLFYVYLDLLNRLPWKDMTDKQICSHKADWSTANIEKMLGHEIPHPLITCWMNIRRGQMVDLCRSNEMKNGTVLLHKYRHLGLKRKLVPTGAMIEFSVIYNSLRLFGGGGGLNPLPLPRCLQVPPPNYRKLALQQQLMMVKMQRNALLLEVQILKKRLKSKEIHDIQMKVEVARNERFIQRYVYDRDDDDTVPAANDGGYNELKRAAPETDNHGSSSEAINKEGDRFSDSML